MEWAAMIHIMKCCICGKMAKAHLLILDKNICSKCENEIVEAEAGDENYDSYQSQLKKLFK